MVPQLLLPNCVIPYYGESNYQKCPLTIPLFLEQAVTAGNYAVSVVTNATTSNSMPLMVVGGMPPSQTSDYLAIKEWGVEFEKPAGMDDLVYAQINIPISADDATASSISFSTQQLMNFDSSCAPEAIPIGSLGRVSNLSEFGDRGVPTNVHVGDYYYFFVTPQATCSDNQQVQALETQQMSALGSEILKTLKVSSL